MPQSTDPAATPPATSPAPVRRRAPGPVDRAWALNTGSQHLAAARDYADLAVAAAQAGQTDSSAGGRFWQGVSLHLAGRLLEAFAALSYVATLPDAASDSIGHMALTRYVLVGIDMPLALETIDDAIAEIERSETASGRRRRSRVLLLKARLAKHRGHLRATVRLALEGHELARRESASFATGAYRRDIVHGLLLLGELDEAERAISAWKEAADPYATTRRALVAAFESMLYRLRGDTATAIERGSAASAASRSSDDVFTWILVEQSRLYAHLCSADPRAGRDALARLIRLRRTESWPIRWDAMLALGDYHLALGRQAAGLPPLDVMTDTAAAPLSAGVRQLSLFGGSADTASAASSFARARRAYRAARALGLTIDRLLACRYRETLLDRRLRLLETSALTLAPQVREHGNAADPSVH